MSEICDPLARWGYIGHTWAHCRGAEEACIEAELINFSLASATVKIASSFQSERVELIPKESYVEYSENGTTWRVYCDGIAMEQNRVKIRICYLECSAYETQAACEVEGCYWYDGACHSIPEPTPKPAIAWAIIGAALIGLYLLLRGE